MEGGGKMASSSREGRDEESRPSFILEVVDEQREGKMALVKKRLEEDRKRLEENLAAPYPFAITPEVVIKDHLLQYVDTASRINLCKASRWVKKVWGSKEDTWTFAEALTIPKLFLTIANIDEPVTSPELMPAPEDPVDVVNKKNEIRSKMGHGLLSTRAICRDWNFAVSNCFDKMDSHILRPNYSDFRAWVKLGDKFERGTCRPYEGQAEWESWPCLPQEPYRFLISERNLELFLENVGGISSVLRIMHFNPERWQWDLRPRILAVLDQFGSKLRNVTFDFSSDFGGRTIELEWVAQCLTRTPRVTRLWLSHTFRNRKDSKKNILAAINFPPLPDLVSLKIRWFTHRNDNCSLIQMVQSLRCYFDQLHTLIVGVGFLQNYDPLLHSKLPNLLRLSTTVLSMDELLKFRDWTCPLKEVDIGVIGHLYCTLPVYFHALEMFWGTLVAIRIHGGLAVGQRAVTMEGLGLPMPSSFTLPQLRLLKFNVGCKACSTLSLDSLLLLSRAPEHLEIRSRPVVCQHEPVRRESVAEGELQFWGHYDNLYQSNVWERLPNVQQILYCECEHDREKLYTRKEYLDRRQVFISAPLQVQVLKPAE